MRIKQTIRNLVLGGLLLVPLVFVATIPAATSYAVECGGVKTAIIECEQTGVKDGGGGAAPWEQSGLWGVLIFIINVMIAGVGVLAVAGFVYGGILYITSGGSPDQVKKAKGIFINVVVGVVAFGAMFVLLNFLIPGGVFN